MLAPHDQELLHAIAASYSQGLTPDLSTERMVVKAILAHLSEIEPGRSVELRIPPYAAIQLVAGHTHRRGTPSAVVETSARTLVALAHGDLTWAEAVTSGALIAGGERSDLSRLFPLD